MSTTLTIALAGNPNAGKTTLFNTLTGSRQHVGNYPGVTVEKKEGIYLHGGEKIRIVDLPGTYSLSAYSVEEVVARDFLVNEHPSVVVNIVDAANLERNLYLTTQFFEMGVPVVLALNMVDVAKDRGIEIDVAKLSELLGVPVIPIVARIGKGVEALMQAVVDVAHQHGAWVSMEISYGEDIDRALIEMENEILNTGFLTSTYPARWTAIKLLEGDQQIGAKGMSADRAVYERLLERVHAASGHLMKTLETFPEAIIADHRYGFVKSILLQDVVSRRYDENRLHTSDKIDKVLTNRFLGPLVMVAVLLGLYHFTFTYSEIPIAWVDRFFALLAELTERVLDDGPLKSLLVSGIINGVGGVLGFVPLIMFMFFGLAFLEDSGYLARVAFMLDRIFRIFGLHGNSVMAYIVSGGIAGGCAVPGVMATRTLRSHRERMATLLTAPFMNCGAKLPVLALLIATFFSKYQAQFMLFSTLLAWSVALLVAKLFRTTILRGDSTPFVMELPPYRFPTMKGLLIHTWEKTWRYIQKAGTVILGVSILLWVMMTYPGLSVDEVQKYEAKRQEVLAAVAPEIAAVVRATDDSAALRGDTLDVYDRLVRIDNDEAEQTLLHSFAGRLGKSLERVTWLAGFDWRSNIALVGGVAAKEVIVSTLGTAYSLGESEGGEDTSLAKTLAAQPGWSPIVALSLIVFTMFYAPCIVTVVCIVKETGSWKWGLFSMGFNTLFAFTLATIVYQTGQLIMGVR